MYIQKAHRQRGVGSDDDDTTTDGTVSVTPGSGGLSPADFNSTKYPGICKPMHLKALGFVQEMQRQANRVASKRGFAKIAVSGDVGPLTVALVGQIFPGYAGKPCITIAADADALAIGMRLMADQAGAPTTVSGPTPPQPASTIGKDGLERPAPPSYQTGIFSTFTAMPVEQKVAAVAVLGGIGYLIATRKKRRK